MELELYQILEATISDNKSQLEAAQTHLEATANRDLPTFLVSLSNELSDVSRSPVVRMAAGLQLKNYLTSKDSQLKEQYQQRWMSVQPELRGHVKAKVLSTLGTESSVMSTAAQCVAYIAVVEVPQRQWPELMPTLLMNVTTPSSTESLKVASLEAIGYICEDIEPQVLQEQANSILTAIIQGMRKEEPSDRVRLAATRALLNSLEFTRGNFETDGERHFIMQVLCEATQCSEVKVRVAALQNLVRIMSLYYQHMHTYMGPALFAITLQAMQSEDDDVALQGVEFWSTVAESEMDLALATAEAREAGRVPAVSSRHYCRGALQFLIPILMNTLTKQEECDDEDEWTPNKAAGVCILLAASCCEDSIIEHVMPFVTANIQSQDWRFREASILAFANILEGPSQSALMPLTVQAMPILIQSMQDSMTPVRDTVAYAVGRVCEFLPEAIVDQTYTGLLVEGILAGLDAEPSVAANYCIAIQSLLETAYEKADVAEGQVEPPTFCLSGVFGTMMAKLLQVTDRTDGTTANLRSSAYEAVMEMIKNSPTDCYPVVQSTTDVIMTRIGQLISMAPQVTAANRGQYTDLQSLLCAALQALLQRMTVEDAAKISENVFATLVALLQLSVTGGVQEDVLMAFGSLIELLGEDFLKYMETFKPFLLAGLRCRTEHQVCFAAVGLVGDLSRSVGPQAVLGVGDEVVAILLDTLSDASVHHTIKPQVLSVFGDMALAIGTHFTKYLEPVLAVLREASRVQMNTQQDREYLDELREAILEGYTGIVQGLKGDDENAVNPEVAFLQNHPLADMLQFIEIVASDPYHTDSIVAVACGLIGDLCKAFGKDLLPHVDKNVYHSLLAEGRQSKTNKTKTLATWASKVMRRLKVV